MATEIEQTARRRVPLTKERILQAAVALADEGGVESLGMRRIAQELDVVPMALYKHVANKDEMLDGMVDVVVGEIDPPWQGPTGRPRSGSGSSLPAEHSSATPGRRRSSSRGPSRRRRSSATWTR